MTGTPAFTGRRVSPGALGRAIAAAGAGFARVADEGVREKLRAALPQLPEQTAELVVPYTRAGDPMSVAGAGAAVARLRAALLAERIGSAWVPADPTTVADLVPLPGEPLGVLALGMC